MNVALDPKTDQRLRQEAARRGVAPEDFARQLIETQLFVPQPGNANQPALKMLEDWDREDRTEDPDEIARRQQQFEEFKSAINASHSSNRKIYP